MYSSQVLASSKIRDTTYLLTLAVDYNELSLMEYALTNTADMMLKIKQVDRAAYFFN
jgi:hypothetical protein